MECSTLKILVTLVTFTTMVLAAIASCVKNEYEFSSVMNRISLTYKAIQMAWHRPT